MILDNNHFIVELIEEWLLLQLDSDMAWSTAITFFFLDDTYHMKHLWKTLFHVERLCFCLDCDFIPGG